MDEEIITAVDEVTETSEPSETNSVVVQPSYDNYFDVIIHYQAFQSAELIIILFLCAAILGSQFMRGFWGR